MQELVTRITSSLGIDEALAEKAIGIILGMLKTSGPEDKVSSLLSAMPGAEALIAKTGGAEEQSGGGGLLGGLTSAIGGGNPLMDTLSKLQGAGLDMGQAQSAGTEVLSFAREKAGDELVKEVASAIPGLSQFV